MPTTNSEIGAFINAQTELTSVDGTSDFVGIYDTSAGQFKKAKPDNILSGASGLPTSGWVDSTAETWTYVSVSGTTSVFKISGVDLTTKYQAGQRIKLTQTTVKYFIITQVVFSTDTTITMYGGTDYALTNAAISANYYSPVKAPFGFPLDPTKWTVETSDTGSRTQASPTDGTWYNLGGLSIVIPTGIWRVMHEEWLFISKTTAAGLLAKSTLSTANNSESDVDFTSAINLNAAANSGDLRLGAQVHKEKFLTLASSATYYLNAVSTQNSAGSIAIYGSIAKTFIRAVCAYL